jgi:hypothetical protein
MHHDNLASPGLRLGLALVFALTMGGPVLAEQTGGGGPKKSDCLVEFDFGSNTPTKAKRNKTFFECNDCDASCDADGQPNGVCEFHFEVCPNQCDPPVTLKRLRVRGAAGNASTSSTTCSEYTASVKTKRHGKKPGTKTVRVLAKSKKPRLTDNDSLIFKCKPSTGTCPTTTTTTPTTTTTTTIPQFLDFTTGPPDLVSCVSGHTYDAPTGGNVIKDLHCGGLNIGGGPSTVAEGATPENATSRFTITGCTGSVCNLGPTTAPGVGFECTDTGCNFGPPLPIANAGTSTCVLNTFSSPGGGTIDASTGDGATMVPLSSNTFLTGNAIAPCPRCVAGTCERGPDAGNACTTTNAAGTTQECQPDGTNLGSLAVDLTPLTGGLTSLSDAGGLFCPGQGAPTNPAVGPKPGCFGSASCQRIEEQGSPAGPLTPGVPAASTLASVFCVPETPGALGTLVNLAAGLPGPGATSLPGTLNLVP